MEGVNPSITIKTLCFLAILNFMSLKNCINKKRSLISFNLCSLYHQAGRLTFWDSLEPKGISFDLLFSYITKSYKNGVNHFCVNWL